MDIYIFINIYFNLHEKKVHGIIRFYKGEVSYASV